MKKFFALLAVVLAVVSCQKDVDNLDVNVGGEVDTTITVSLPETTRATNSAEGAFVNVVESNEYTIRYIFQVFYNGTESKAARQVIYSDNKVVCFPVRLVSGRHYNFVVWADVVMEGGKSLDQLGVYEASADLHYNTAELTNITLNKTWVAMDETRDAFTGHFDTAVDGDKTPYNGAKSINIRLTRPFAKLRIITTDMEQLNDLGIAPTKATVEYTVDHYNAFNAFAGQVINDSKNRDIKHENFYIKAYGDNVDDKSKVLFTDYFFAADNEEVVNFTFDVYDQNNELIKSNAFTTDIPVKRNNLTTIKGDILTDGNGIKVEVKDEFGNGTNWDPEYDEYDVNIWDGKSVKQPAQDADGNYIINEGAELAWIADQVNGVTRAAANNFSGKTIVLAKNINLGGHEWTPIGCAGKHFAGTFDGDDHIVGNFQITKQEGHAALFGNARATIKNLTVIDAKIVAHHYAGGIVGQGYVNMDKCHVNNIDITLSAKNGDWGDKAGGLVGQNCEGAKRITNSTAKNVKIQGYRDLGGIVGMAHNNNIVSDCYAENITILQDLSVNYQDSTPNTLGAVIGRKGSNVTYTNNREGEGNNISVIIAEGVIQDKVTETYTVSSAEGMQNIVEIIEEDTDASIVLGGDIDLAELAAMTRSAVANNWTPIGTSEKPFTGTFDGNGCTIKNLVIDGGSNSNIGFFGFTTNGEIKNVTFENAKVSGRLNVGVVAGTPYTSKYTNITVKGHVEVNGMAYVGAVGGKNAYADWTNITVNVDETSYVNANSVENGTAYRTYVGGVCGFNGEGGHSFKNIRSNIDVKGSTCDVGGLFGIAHYGNQFENCVCTGDVEIYNASEEGDAQEIGGIAGVWHPGGADVVMTNCSFDGLLKANNNYTIHTYKFGNLVCAAYNSTDKGKLIIDGKTYLASENTKVEVSTADELVAALKNNFSVKFANDITIAATEGGYKKAGILQNKAQTIDGNGYTLTVTGAGGTWDCAIYTNGGLIKNLTVKGAMRGIFTAGQSSDLNIENVTFKNVIYTFNSDGKMPTNPFGVYVSDSTLNGWTSHSNMHTEVVYTNCSFGEGSGYKFCRPYGKTEFINCTFCPGYTIDESQTTEITYTECTFEE